MVRHKKDEDTLNTIFCDRCGTLYRKINVDEKTIMPMCPICHMELFKYFVNEDNKFIHFGNFELFAEISEKLENNTAKLNFNIKSSFERPNDRLQYGEFVGLIRDRTRKMVLMETRFKPQTELQKRKHSEESDSGESDNAQDT